jgi:putative transcriptional regulator
VPIRNDIRRLRFDRDEMSQQALADRVGVTRQTINAVEQNKYSPSLETAFRIAHVFGVPLERVFQYHADGRPRR